MGDLSPVETVPLIHRLKRRYFEHKGIMRREITMGWHKGRTQCSRKNNAFVAVVHTESPSVKRLATIIILTVLRLRHSRRQQPPIHRLVLVSQS